MRKVRVELGANSYDIIIGAGLVEEFKSFVSGAKFSKRCMVITDSNLVGLYGHQVKAVLEEAGFAVRLETIPAGESSKCLDMAQQLYTAAIEHGMDRKSPVFALGGGVVGDLAGFVAATYMRGVPFVQMATSLLAQVDSSVGGKVAVNHPLGKNLIGAFYQPKAVFIDLNMLKTLPQREILTGLGEIVKHGIIYDAQFFQYLEDNAEAALRLEPAVAEHMVARSCEIKAAVVSEDEKEAGLRTILNFGHTMAHAIEKETGYTRYNHGEAVAIGMAGASYISRALGLVRDQDLQRIMQLMHRLGLPDKAAGCTVDAMYQDIFHDKKTVNGKVKWVLLRKIGLVMVYSNVKEDVIKQAMGECLE